MLDPLLFKNIVVPVNVIHRLVSEVTNEPIFVLTMSSKTKGARKGENCLPRQLSMCMCKNYTKLSLERIGDIHGGRDHATVIHAIKTIENLVDTHHFPTNMYYTEVDKKIRKWKAAIHESKTFLPELKKQQLVKIWIKNKVPIDIRHKLLIDYYNKCPHCNQVLPKFKIGHKKRLPY